VDDRSISALLPRAHPGVTPRGPDCPAEDLLVAFVQARLAEEDRARLELHLADCAFCRSQVGFLAREAELGPLPAVPTHLLAAASGERSVADFRFRRFRLAPLALGAAALGAMLVLLPMRDRAPAPAGETRAPAAAVSGAPELLRPREGESVPRTNLLLLWRASPAALGYRIELVDAEGDRVWSGRSEATRLKLPTRVALEPGRAYYVWISAELPSGGLVRSPAVGFRAAPE